MEELLLTAKQIYIAGIEYEPAHYSGVKCTVSDPENFKWELNYIKESSGNKRKNGHSITEVILNEQDWARILNEDPLDTAIRVYKPGTKVKAIYGSADLEYTVADIPYYDTSRSNKFIQVRAQEFDHTNPALWSLEKGWSKILKLSENQVLEFLFNN